MFILKLLLSNLLIITCVLLGRRFPSSAGLLAVMPLTSLIVMVWLYSESPENSFDIQQYLHGLLLGIIPTVAFFAAMSVLIRRGISVHISIALSCIVWLLGAAVHWALLNGHISSGIKMRCLVGTKQASSALSDFDIKNGKGKAR